MSDRMKESISALCDGECDELEFRRLLNQMELEPELQEDWRRYHIMGAVMRGEPAANIDLLQGINQGIDGIADASSDQFQENSDSTRASASNGYQGISQMLLSGAVAASVTLAVLVGVRMNVENTSLPASNLAESQPVSTPLNSNIQSVSSSPVFSGQAKAVNVALANSTEASAEELDKAQQALQEFVLDNADSLDQIQQTPASTYGRVANFGQETEVEAVEPSKE